MISKENRKIIHDELARIAKLMRETEDSKTKMYYYSACYGMTNRILNLAHDTGLSLIDLVLNATFSTISGGIQQPSAFPFPTEILERLPDLVEELAKEIKGGKAPDALKKIATLSYISTGNGHYLYKAGKLKLP
ncbi:MAG: hypothetical protein KAW09_07495 [Thermoplasmata archaeon]|nr:hypothetical protein [Thermoplasmata archaeon]